jgi:glycine/D-amino acid oxidase-like deaminating enzyme
MSKKTKTRPTQARKTSAVQQWDIEIDVAVVGFGGAGACAAIEAFDAGAEVAIFELASAAGGSTALSGADIYMGGDGGTRVQQACGYEDSNQDMFNYLMAANGPQADEDKIRHYVENSIDHFNWLVEKGIPYKDTEVKERVVMPLTDDCLIFSGSEKAYRIRANDGLRAVPERHRREFPDTRARWNPGSPQSRCMPAQCRCLRCRCRDHSARSRGQGERHGAQGRRRWR